MNHAQHTDSVVSPVHTTLNGISAKVTHTTLDNHPSPVTDSPDTPVNTAHAPDVKIDMDYQEQESDVRHEPLPIKAIDRIDKFNPDDASTVSQVATPCDPSTIPIHAPNGTPPPPPGELLDDVKMAEVPLPNGHLNGHSHDVVMADHDSQTPAATPGISQDFSMASIDGSSASMTRSYPDDSDDHREPPAKRMRTHFDAEMAHSATPPPASAESHAASPAPPPPSSVMPPPTTAGSSSSHRSHIESTIGVQQWRFLNSTVRTLKKLKESQPFLLPVDPIALNIPHYPSIVKNPMDFSTIERKLASSSPQKPDPNTHNPRYYSADEFVADIRLMVSNAVTFNGPEHAVALMGKRMEDVFDKQLKHLPPVAEKPKPPVVKKLATPPAPPPPVVAPVRKASTARRPSTSVPTIRRSEAEAIGRPKREIHPPPPKDLPYADVPKKMRKGKRSKHDGTSEQLKYCSKILHELNKKQYYSIAYPFYEPVDWQKLEIPSYPKIIRRPMDLSTIRKKLDGGEYDTAQNFYDDFKLMIRNCFSFNPSGTPVNLAGQELQRLFDDKWRGLPPLQSVEVSEEEEDEEEEDSDEERRRAIARMESQIETMKNNIESLKGSKKEKEKKKKEKKEKIPVASTSKPPPKQPKAAPPKKKKSAATTKNITDDDVLTFEQKKDLSESIGKLDGARLERVIQIIHEGVPEIRDSTEEIELEIDQLPAAVLTKLYNFVLRPTRQPAQPKRNRTGKGTGTGGLKRKSMDEEKEAEKIRQLEERMALFEPRGGLGQAASAPARRDDDSDHSSDSSDNSDSSGSDSE